MTKRSRRLRGWVAIPILIIFLIIGAFVAKKIYNKFQEPDFYNPNGEVNHVSPASRFWQEDTITPKEAGPKALLPGAKWVAQTFNNCGPATTSMVLQYFGHSVSQEETKSKLRTNPDDKNVFTYEIADYIKNDYEVSSKLLYGGDINLLKKLISNGFYVVVEDWLYPNEDIGHTTIIRGYDDEQRVLIADDSFIGVNITYPYDEFVNSQWKPFNYEYLPVYKPESEDLLRAIVGSNWDRTTMYQNAIKKAEQEIEVNQNDMYAWFNLGTSQYELGNFGEAKVAFEKSRSIGWPKRMLWYQIQPIQTLNMLGEYLKAIELANLALAGNDSFAEAHLEKAIAYKGLGDLDKARSEVNSALSYSPNLKKAMEFLESL